MDLNIIWFILITVLFIGFFFLEGFDYGVGILLRYLGKDDKSRRQIINAIGPHWDGNEVWLITAGGAMFAAFPHWYATMFSGFYLALAIMLLALIGRGVAFEFRSKHDTPEWRNMWDWAIFTGSFIPALLWGVAVANLVRGVPIDADMNYTGTFFSLLNPYGLLGGLVFLLVFTVHGGLFLSIKLSGELLEKVKEVINKLWLPTTIVFVGFMVSSYFATDMYTKSGITPGIVPIIAGITFLAVRFFTGKGKYGWAFGMSSLTIILFTITIFMSLFPRVMISSSNPEWSLTIYNASSSQYTLEIMTWSAIIFVPFVLGYQAWSYWVFRKRITNKTELEY